MKPGEGLRHRRWIQRAKCKLFSVRDWYPEGYPFDHQGFYSNPDTYKFSVEYIAYLNALELEEYESKVPMHDHERSLLRKWVASGHSPSENDGSKYLCLTGYGSYDFIDVYRIEQKINKITKTMSSIERDAYIRNEFLGQAGE